MPKEALACEIDTSTTDQLVVRALNRIEMERGFQKKMLTDKMPESMNQSINDWICLDQIKHHFIQLEKPVGESSNGKLRDECLGSALCRKSAQN